MTGFFTEAETQDAQFSVSSKPLCGRCKLHKTCKSPKMQPTGSGDKGILVIAEAPGAREDDRGIQLIGKAGSLLRRELAHVADVDLDVDCIKMNAVNCRPPHNRKPTDTEVQCCQPMVFETIKKMKPKVILLLGGSAVKSFLRGRYDTGNDSIGAMERWRGWNIPDREFGCWVLPTFHPSYVARMEGKIDEKSIMGVWRRDLSAVHDLLHRNLPIFKDEKECVRCVGVSEAISYMKYLLHKKPLTALDFETTGVKPYDHTKHTIRSVAFSDRPDRAVSFLLEDGVIPWIIDVLSDREIPKVAHNAKYEHVWSMEILRTKIKNLVACTMLDAHILDQRRRIAGLKFQAYVRFGIVDYDSVLHSYLVAKSANGRNEVFRVPVDDLLLYNGIDALLTRRLHLWQQEEFKQCFAQFQ